MRNKISLITLSILLSSLLSSCATTSDTMSPSVEPNANGSLSPLPTRANPWNQVNPGNQAAYQATRGR